MIGTEIGVLQVASLPMQTRGKVSELAAEEM
jgi:hypothetical protein